MCPLVRDSLRPFIKPGINARQHDTTHSPVGLWQLDGGLTDSSGNGFTLTVEAGTERYAQLPGGIQGFFFDAATNLVRSAAEATLLILGDMTIECLCEWIDSPPPTAPNFNTVIVSHVGTHGSSTEANNAVYRLGAAPTPGLRYFAESGAGSSILHDSVDGVAQSLQHLAMVRSSDEITFYVNGGAIAATSSGLATPTGGGSGRFRLGASEGLNVPVKAVISSVKLIASALTAQQIADEYGRTLG